MNKIEELMFKRGIGFLEINTSIKNPILCCETIFNDLIWRNKNKFVGNNKKKSRTLRRNRTKINLNLSHRYRYSHPNSYIIP